MSRKIYELLKICFDKEFAICSESAKDILNGNDFTELDMIKCYMNLEFKDLEKFSSLIDTISKEFKIHAEIKLEKNKNISKFIIDDINITICIKNDSNGFNLRTDPDFYNLLDKQLRAYKLKIDKKKSLETTSQKIYKLLKICFDKRYALCNGSSNKLLNNDKLDELTLIKCYPCIMKSEIDLHHKLIKILSQEFDFYHKTRSSMGKIYSEFIIDGIKIIVAIKKDEKESKLFSHPKFVDMLDKQLMDYGFKCIKLND